MQKILLYNIKGKKYTDIKMICHKLNITSVNVEKDKYGYSLEYITGISDNPDITDSEDFDDEMLLFVNLSNVMLDKVLNTMRKKKATVELKAVLTETNKKYNSSQLHKEINEEHNAMQQGNSIHN